jgi:hypothetical protein
MKKLILAAMILGLAGTGVQTAKAGDREWAVVGKVLTGITAAAVITHAVAAEPAPVYYPYSCAAPACGYCPPPAPSGVVYVQTATAPVVVYRAPVCVVPAPVCFAPAPVVSFRFGGGYHRFHHDRW